MDPTNVPEPVAKRADQLVVGDRIQPGYLPAYARSGEGRVMLVDLYPYRGADWVFVAFACADGDRNCAHYLPEGTIHVVPAADPTGLGYSRADDDPEVTQPIVGRRREPHFEDGLAVVEVAGGGIEVAPPEGFVPASAPGGNDSCPRCIHSMPQHDHDGCCLACHCHPGCTSDPICGER